MGVRIPLFHWAPSSAAQIRTDYRDRLLRHPTHAPKTQQLEAALPNSTDQRTLLNQSAGAWTVARTHPAMVVRFTPHNLTMEVASRSGIFDAARSDFMVDSPTTGLWARPITERSSVHVPNIAGIERASLASRAAASGGQHAFGNQQIPVEIVEDVSLLGEYQPSRLVLSMLPAEFDRSGAILVTPLGLEISTDLGFGFVYEYRAAGPFPFDDIHEARTLSAALMLRIASLAQTD